MTNKINLLEDLEIEIKKIIPDYWISKSTFEEICFSQSYSHVTASIKIAPMIPEEVFVEINSGIHRSRLGPQTESKLAEKDSRWHLENEMLCYLIPRMPLEQFMEKFPKLLNQINIKITKIDEILQKADRETAFLLSYSNIP